MQFSTPIFHINSISSNFFTPFTTISFCPWNGKKKFANLENERVPGAADVELVLLQYLTQEVKLETKLLIISYWILWSIKATKNCTSCKTDIYSRIQSYFLFYIVTYDIKWARTFWTYSIWKISIHIFECFRYKKLCQQKITEPFFLLECTNFSSC